MEETPTQAIAAAIDALRSSGKDDLADAVAALWTDAQLDHVTGLHNRASFEKHLEYERSRALRYDRSLSLLVLDVDDFKGMNDRLGHLAGDDVLRCVASTLQRSSRATDRVARIGGDEFALLLPETSEQEALWTAERMRGYLSTLDVVARGATARASVSVGVATLRGAETASALFHRADLALLAAKRGRSSPKSMTGSS